MTTDKMRSIAERLSELGKDPAFDKSSMDIQSTIILIGGEICTRLDKLIEQGERNEDDS